MRGSCFLKPIVALAMVLSIVPLVSHGQTAAPAVTEDEQAIRQLVASFEHAWNTHDMTELGSLFDDDAEFINVVGMHWRGKQAIVKAHTVYHELMFQDCKLHSDQVEVRFLNDQTAVAVWTSTQDPFTTPSGTLMPKSQTRLSFVLSRGDDGWRVIHGHNTRVDAEAAQFDPVNRPM